ncbi:MAG: hypothetical protein Q7Q71_06630 [Verrucomicrobiota bacterium JB023]|nr:hypothetical protein [Verrucomicrobiota bacterium JB023]
MNAPLKVVLTGDIVDSSSLDIPQLETCQELIVTAAKQVEAVVGEIDFPAAGFFRGDSWQLSFDAPHLAARAAIFFRCALLKHQKNPRFDTRVSIGIGTIEKSDSLKSGQGAAYLLSGRGLEEMAQSKKPARRLAFASDTLSKDTNAALSSFAILADHALLQTTPHQALAIYETIRGKTQEEIAQGWNPKVGQPTILRHLRSGGWDYLEASLQELETNFPQ